MACHGATANTISWTAGVFNGTAPFNIGRMGGTTTTYHDGSTDEVVFYKRILTTAERTWLYNVKVTVIYKMTVTWLHSDRLHCHQVLLCQSGSILSYPLSDHPSPLLRTSLGSTSLTTVKGTSRKVNPLPPPPFSANENGGGAILIWKVIMIFIQTSNSPSPCEAPCKGIRDR